MQSEPISSSPEGVVQQVPDKDDGFDPYKYGKPDGIGLWGAVVHIIRTTIGIGILLIPFLMKRLGYVTGVLLMSALAIVYYHTVHILLTVEYQLSKLLHIEHSSFVGVTDEIFTRAAYPINKFKLFVHALIYFYYGLPVGNITILIVVSTNTQKLAEFFGVTFQPVHIISVIIVPCTLFCMHRRILKILVPLSFITNFCTFLMICIVIGFSIASPGENVHPKPFSDISYIPQALATYIMATRSTGIIIPLKNDMVHPKQLTTPTGSLNIAGLIITSLYVGFGLITYINYGDMVQDNILSNLPSDNALVFLIYVLYSLALIVNYILQFFLRFQTVWTGAVEEQLKNSKFKIVWEYIFKVGINLLAFILAIACPYLALISAISGTIGFLVEIALPSILQLLMMSILKQRSWWLIMKNTVIICISIFAFIMSTISCIKEIKKLYSI